MGKQHLHLLSLTHRDDIIIRLGDISCQIAGTLEDGAHDLAGWFLGNTDLFQNTGLAVMLAGAISAHAIAINGISLFLEWAAILMQGFAAGTVIDVPIGIIDEVGT